MLQRLHRNIELVEVGSRADALAVLEQQSFELVLLDTLMPDATPSKIIGEFREISKESKLIVISATDRPEEIYRYIRQGANGFIPKQSDVDVMLHAVGLVLSGGIYTPPALLGLIDQQTKVREPQSDHELPELTSRQRDVLELLAQGYSNKQVAYELELSESTVKQHVTSLMKLLKVFNRTQVILKAVEIGLLK